MPVLNKVIIGSFVVLLGYHPLYSFKLFNIYEINIYILNKINMLRICVLWVWLNFNLFIVLTKTRNKIGLNLTTFYLF